MDDQATAATTAGFSLGSCLFQMGGGAIGGVAVGYAMKAAVRMALLVMGGAIIFLYFMAHSGFITVNWDTIFNGVQSGTQAAGSWAYSMITDLSSTVVGFSGGAIAGWKYHK